MELSNSIASLAMNMSAARFQQNLQMSVLKKSMEMDSDIVNSLLQMIEPAPKFSGDNGTILDVRA